MNWVEDVDPLKLEQKNSLHFDDHPLRRHLIEAANELKSKLYAIENKINKKRTI